MVSVLFYFSLLILLYVYVGYPLLICILSKVSEKKVLKNDWLPNITVIIAAYNEESCIGKTIENKLQQDYPVDKLEIIVVSDESTDNTDKIVTGFSDRNVHLIRQEPRQGKTQAINTAIKKAKGEVIVFSDANSLYKQDAIRKLVMDLSDPSVGYVTGKMIYMNEEGDITGDGCSTYMRYENRIRLFETNFYTVIGVDGGIDAIRKHDFVEMQPDQLPDFVQPLHMIRKGLRVAYEENAILMEETTKNITQEYHMRVRVTLRALWTIFYFKDLLNPLKYLKVSWQLISHKVLRYITWLPLVILFICNILLLGVNKFYIFLFIAQVVMYVLATIAHFRAFKKNQNIFLILPYYFTLLNITSAHGCLKFVMGHKQVMWNPRGG